MKSTENSRKSESAIESQVLTSESVISKSEQEARAPPTPMIGVKERTSEQKDTEELGNIQIGGIAEHVARALVEEIRRLMDVDRDTGSKGGMQKDSRDDPYKDDQGLVGNEDIGRPLTPAKPTLEKSWEVITKEVTALDEAQVGGWKDDIDTLLVFAGLFSAVVTAFTIESYQWLKEAPEDTTVILLQSIYRQLNNTAPEPEVFAVSPIDVKINVLWFLSLIVALVDALFALLCKQWLREHRRHTHTRTPSEALALSWLRQKSLVRWSVHTILASLPMLLELAVFLFLTGVLVLLWDRHRVVFGIALGVVGSAGLFYLGTTIIPTVDIVRQALQVTWMLRGMRNGMDLGFDAVKTIMSLPPMEYTCPYKSPQAWAVFQLSKIILRIPGAVRALYFLCRKDHKQLSSPWAFNKTLSNLSNWSLVDLEIVQRSTIKLAPPIYELSAFRWLVTELRDSPIMIPHLHNILHTLPINLVMPGVLNQWLCLPHREWDHSDIEKVLPTDNTKAETQFRRWTFLDDEIKTTFFNRLLHIINIPDNSKIHSRLELLQQLLDEQRLTNISDGVGLPIHIIDKLYRDDDEGLQQCLTTLPDILGSLSTVKWYHGYNFIRDMASYIIASSPDYALHNPKATTTSSFVRSVAGCKYLSRLHETIGRNSWYDDDWMEAMDIVRRVHGLPEGHFKSLLPSFPLPLSKLKKTLTSIPPTDLKIDFGYLESFSRNWGGADINWKGYLVDILSNHITHCPQSNIEPPSAPDHSMISLLIVSSPGLDLITFINNKLVDDGLPGYDRTAWREAIERVQKANPELPPDHFRPIPDEGTDASSPEVQQTEAGYTGTASQPIGALEVVEHGFTTARVPSLVAAENTSRSDDRDVHEKGSMPMTPLVSRDRVSRSRIEHGEVGGPDADRNV